MSNLHNLQGLVIEIVIVNHVTQTKQENRRPKETKIHASVRKVSLIDPFLFWRL